MSGLQIILYYLAGSWGLALLGCLPLHRAVLAMDLKELDQQELSEDEKQERAVRIIETCRRATIVNGVFAPLLLLAGVIALPFAGLWYLGKVIAKGVAKVAYPRDAISKKYLGGYAKFSGE